MLLLKLLPPTGDKKYKPCDAVAAAAPDKRGRGTNDCAKTALSPPPLIAARIETSRTQAGTTTDSGLSTHVSSAGGCAR
jgi:hypothetical protein